VKTIAAFAISCWIGLAQHLHHQPSQNENPVSLYPGLGTWTHPIRTRSAEAQKYFDQGLTLFYGFNRYEALRSFRKVLELDPSAAMGQWGVAMALGPHINMDMSSGVNMKLSCDALNAGLGITDITATERVWLEAAAARCPDYSQPQNYVAAMRVVAERLPDDPDAQTLLAESLLVPVRWRWYSPRGQPADGVEEAERVLEGVLRRYPNHPGANHFYIHVVESSPTPERAVPSAQRLMGIVPRAGHMVHMPGHIWLALGEYDYAAAVNERTAQVDREYFASTGVINGGYYDSYLHNLLFVVYARAMQGRIAETRKAIDAIREAMSPIAQSMPEMVGLFGVYVSMIEMRMGMWDDLLAAQQPNGENPFIAGMWHYGRALALGDKGRLIEAGEQRQHFEQLRKKMDGNLPWGADKLDDVMELAAASLDARLETDPEAAVAKWRRAVDLQDRLRYFEPPPWCYPVRESLGAALLISGDAAAAETVFRDGLRRSPNNGRMLFGLRESLKAQHKSDGLVWVEREFQRAWKDADLQLRLKDF
jgi:tetratricopeptide (TPR) repeat protein